MDLQTSIDSYKADQVVPLLYDDSKVRPPRTAAQRQRAKSQLSTKLQMEIQLKMFLPDRDAAGGADIDAEERKQRRELDKISKVCNRYVQSHDPFIQKKFESFHRSKNRHKSESDNHKLQRLRNARSHSELISDFLERRGIAYGERPQKPEHHRLKTGNSSSQCLATSEIIDRMHRRGNVGIVKEQQRQPRIVRLRRELKR